MFHIYIEHVLFEVGVEHVDVEILEGGLARVEDLQHVGQLVRRVARLACRHATHARAAHAHAPHRAHAPHAALPRPHACNHTTTLYQQM